VKTQNIEYRPELEVSGIEFLKTIFHQERNPEVIDSVNWPADFPAKPEVHFAIYLSAKSLFIHWQVRDEILRAEYLNDQDPVWLDSCVEFFCQVPGREGYFNFEFNCIGTCLASHRLNRNEQVFMLSEDKMQQIKRLSSLERNVVTEQMGDFSWSLSVEIPFSVLGINAASLPQTIAGNVYKCADATSKPHYVSWNPIKTMAPDFHRPEFFGEMRFYL
jgi:hypothetical protein